MKKLCIVLGITMLTALTAQAGWLQNIMSGGTVNVSSINEALQSNTTIRNLIKNKFKLSDQALDKAIPVISAFIATAPVVKQKCPNLSVKNLGTGTLQSSLQSCFSNPDVRSVLQQNLNKALTTPAGSPTVPVTPH